MRALIPFLLAVSHGNAQPALHNLLTFSGGWSRQVGGYPFEVAKPEEIFKFFHDRGFTLRAMTTCGGGLGCNEFVFERTVA